MTQEKVAGWQTAYAAAKMAVEIAKESSDMFPPLKAVVGAMSVLFQNYDVSVSRPRTEHPSTYTLVSLQQTTDNGEAVKDIERRVHLLSSVLTSPINEDDYAEKARRMGLRRSVFVQICANLLTPPSGS